jgi:hypothetical protein
MPARPTPAEQALELLHGRWLLARTRTPRGER